MSETSEVRTHPPVALLPLRTVSVVAALVKGKASLVDILVHQSHNAGLVRPRRVVRSPEQDLPDDVGPLGSGENLFSLLYDVPGQLLSAGQL